MATAALPLLGGLGTSLLGGLAGLFNPRPPAMTNQQSTALNQLLPSLTSRALGTPTEDPTQQKLMYGNIAQSLTGANNAVTNALVSRGLGHSGLLGAGLMQNQGTAIGARNQADLGLQQQAVGLQQSAIQQLLQGIQANNAPGQTQAGAFTAGMAPVAAYSLQSMLNRNNNLPPVPGSTAPQATGSGTLFNGGVS